MTGARCLRRSFARAGSLAPPFPLKGDAEAARPRFASARTALDAAHKPRGKVGVSGEESEVSDQPSPRGWLCEPKTPGEAAIENTGLIRESVERMAEVGGAALSGCRRAFARRPACRGSSAN